MKDTTTLIVKELLELRDTASPSRPVRIALALPEEAVEDLAEAA